MILKAIVGPAQEGKRLDDGVKELFPQLSKTRIRRIIDWGGCTVDNAKVRVASRKLRRGEEIIIGVIEEENCRNLVYEKKDMVHEDADCLAVAKEAGINAQRTPYQLKGTVEFAVEMYLKKHGICEPARVVHRLDRGTSGVMIFPKNRKYAAYLSTLLKEGRVEKTYLALVTGNPGEPEWTTDAPVAKVGKSRYGVATPGKEARTIFKVLAQVPGWALLQALPITGRTHQIRVHLEHCGLPIVGDVTYEGVKAQRMMLHCFSMAFDPGNGTLLKITAPPDEAFISICRESGIEIPLKM